MIPRRSLPITTLAMLLTIASLPLVVPPAAVANDETKKGKQSGTKQETVEAEIWNLEQAYWEYNRDADHKRIIASWHDKFLGWPDAEPKPIDKEQGARYARKNYAKPASYSFMIEPTGIQVLGDVAVNHYRVHLTSKDGDAKERKRSMRITHTWIQSGSGWKILGGMSDSE